MAKLTLTDLSSIQNDTSAISKINTNHAAIETAFDNTLSRDGTSPNQMLADLDMNSKRILNLPEPTSDNEPVRLIDYTPGASSAEAAASAAAAAASATLANTYADTAATHETNAANSATAAANSATDAANSAASITDVISTIDTVTPETKGNAVGDGVADDLSALQTAATYALAHNRPLEMPDSSKIYGISAPWSPPAGLKIVGNLATIKALPGFTQHQMILPTGSLSIEGVAFDGTNMPNPDTTWVGVGLPQGCCIGADFRTGTRTGPYTIRKCSFSNFKGGPIELMNVSNIRIEDNEFSNVQTYWVNSTDQRNGVVEIYDVQDGCQIHRNKVSVYNWKYIEVDIAIGGVISSNQAWGYAGPPGHAAYHDVQNFGVQWIGNFVDGGYGHKSTDSVATIVDGITVRDPGTSGAINFQSSTGWVLENWEVQDNAATSQYFITVTTASGTDCVGRIGPGKGNRIGTATFTHDGILLIGTSGCHCIVDIDSVSLEGCYYGINTSNVATAYYELTVKNPQFLRTGKADAFIFARNLDWSGGQYGGGPYGILVASETNIPGLIAKIRGYNGTLAAGAVGVGFNTGDIAGIGCQFELVDVSDLDFINGSNTLVADFSGASAYAKTFRLRDVTHRDAAASNAVSITGNTSVKSRVDIRGVALPVSGSTNRAISITNSASWIDTGSFMDYNDVAADSRTKVVRPLRTRNTNSTATGAITINPGGTDDAIQIFNATLTGNVTVTIDTSGMKVGDQAKFIRVGGGSANLLVNSSWGLHTVAQFTGLTLEWDGTYISPIN